MWPLGTRLAARDKAGSLEDPQVLHHPEALHAWQRGSQLAECLAVGVEQTVEQQAAARVSEGPEDVSLLGGILVGRRSPRGKPGRRRKVMHWSPVYRRRARVFRPQGGGVSGRCWRQRDETQAPHAPLDGMAAPRYRRGVAGSPRAAPVADHGVAADLRSLGGRSGGRTGLAV